jgi:hypothetical protein
VTVSYEQSPDKNLTKRPAESFREIRGVRVLTG